MASFESCQDCPKCGELATHWLDWPKPAPTPEDFREWALLNDKFLKDPGDKVVAWGGQVMGHIGGFPKPKELVDESGFEVMRVCIKCKHRWGNV